MIDQRTLQLIQKMIQKTIDGTRGDNALLFSVKKSIGLCNQKNQ